MKRIIALILALAAIFTLTACGNGDVDTSKDPATDAPEATQDNTPAASSFEDPLAVLDAIWEKYTEDELFPALGGNRDAMVENAPGAFDFENAAEELTSSFLLPEANMADLKAVATLVNMMNGNTFSAAVFETDGDLDALSQVLVDAANAKQFICGAPETMVTLKVGQYLIMVFGADGNVQTFKTHALELEGVSLIHEGPITFSGNPAGGGLGGGIIIPGF